MRNGDDVVSCDQVWRGDVAQVNLLSPPFQYLFSPFLSHSFIFRSSASSPLILSLFFCSLVYLPGVARYA